MIYDWLRHTVMRRRQRKWASSVNFVITEAAEGESEREAGIAKTELIFLYAFFAWREIAGSMKDTVVLAHQSNIFALPVDILITVFGQMPNNQWPCIR